MIPAHWRQVRMSSQMIAVLGAALVVIVIVLAYLGRDTRTIEEVQRERDRAPAVSAPGANASAKTAPAPNGRVVESTAALEQQTPLERGIAKRKARDDAACQGGDENACANLRAVVRTRQDYAVCERDDDADACRRVLNSLRSPDPREEMHERCEIGDTRACVMLSNFHLNIDLDAKRVGEYQATALAQLKADTRPQRREAAAAIESELGTLGEQK